MRSLLPAPDGTPRPRAGGALQAPLAALPPRSWLSGALFPATALHGASSGLRGKDRSWDPAGCPCPAQISCGLGPPAPRPRWVPLPQSHPALAVPSPWPGAGWGRGEERLGGMHPGAAMSTDGDGRALSTSSLHQSQNLRGKAGDGGGAKRGRAPGRTGDKRQEGEYLAKSNLYKSASLPNM